VTLCRVRRDIRDARQFVLALAYVLNDYSDKVIREVTDPATGLPGSLRYPLEIADVVKACQAVQSRLAMREFARRERERQEAAVATDVSVVLPEAKPQLSEKELDEQFDRLGLKHLRLGKGSPA
jgi:hypothetical protein